MTQKQEEQKLVSRSEATDGPRSNVVIHVKYTATNFEWGKSTSDMVPLSTPIITTSPNGITYEFVRTGSIALWFKIPPSAPQGSSLPTSNGPTVFVHSGTRQSVAFATSEGGPYSSGYVKVSDGGIDP